MIGKEKGRPDLAKRHYWYESTVHIKRGINQAMP